MVKAKPGVLNYASAGIGSFQHLSSALFVNLAKVDIVHVPFKGGGPAMMDMMAGNTQLILGALVQTLPQIKAGTPKAVLERLYKELTAIQNSPELARRFEAEAVEAVQMTPAEFGRFNVRGRARDATV